MTIQDMIDKLNTIENKNLEIKFISNITMEEMIIVDELECIDDYTFCLEFK